MTCHIHLLRSILAFPLTPSLPQPNRALLSYAMLTCIGAAPKRRQLTRQALLFSPIHSTCGRTANSCTTEVMLNTVYMSDIFRAGFAHIGQRPDALHLHMSSKICQITCSNHELLADRPHVGLVRTARPASSLPSHWHGLRCM